MGSGEETVNRKYDHIKITLNEDVTYRGRCRDIYSSIRLIHQALPLLSYSDIDTSIEFLGHRLRAPLMITGMTGGHRDVTEINRALAEVAEETGIAIGVGSQRAMIEKREPEILRSYRVVRETAHSVPVIGNIGANTLPSISLDDIDYIVSYIEADALAIHLNPGQELVQPEGDTDFGPRVLEKIAEVADHLSVPVIIKEVGTGLSMETVKTLSEAGIRYFDVSGACGTNWMIVEKYRRRDAHTYTMIDTWGIPTPISVIEARWINPSAYIIASGGVWTGYYVAVNLALGANMAGLALPVLRAVINGGKDAGIRLINSIIDELKATMYLIGARSIRELRATRSIVFYGDVAHHMVMRGIDHHVYMEIKSGGEE